MSEYWEGVQDVIKIIQDIIDSPDKVIDQLSSRQALSVLNAGLKRDLEDNG